MFRSAGRPRAVEKLEDRTFFAVSLPAGFQMTDYVTGLPECTSMCFTPDGRIFYTEKSGAVRVVENGQILPNPLVKVSVDGYFERGLEDIVLDPDFANNGVFYLYYTKRDNANPNTAPNNAKNRISRFQIDPNNPDHWDSSKGESVVIDNIGSETGYHNGGFMAFDQSGPLDQRLLYVGVGENGLPSIQDALNTSQDLSTLNGKILRINPREGAQLVPTDNPFVNTPGARPEIYAYGIRNPFTGNVKPGTDTIYVNDVGSTIAEEINQVAKGANYGYPKSEGYTDDPQFTSPIYAYTRQQFNSTQAAITGGTFYEGSMFPSSYDGKYFFADETNQFIRLFDPSVPKQSTGFGTGVGHVLDLDVGPDGALYGLTHTVGDNTAKIVRISYVGAGANRAPTAVATSDKSSGDLPLTVNFDASSSTDPDNDALTYSWNFGDGSTGAGKTVSHTYTTAGKFNAVLTVDDGKGGSNSAQPIVVTTNDTAPIVTITMPANGAPYSGGDVITYSGTATDAEDGTIDPSKFDWTVILHHEDHTHPFLDDGIDGVSGGQFTIPRDLEVDPVQHFQILLKVTDSSGVTTTSTVDINPRTSTFTLASNIAGMTLNLDGVDKPSGTATLGVVGTRRRIEAPATQTVDGVDYHFVGWSDGGDVQHDILTPADDTTYTAEYAPGASATPTAIVTQPTSTSVAIGQPATFSVQATGDSLGYQWQRDGVAIDGATGASYTIPAVSPDDNATTYQVVVTGADGTVSSDGVTLTAATPVGGPTPVIKSPASGQRYSAGQTIRYKSAATDASGKKLPASAYAWRVEFHHDGLVDPVTPQQKTPGKAAGVLKIPRAGAMASANGFYRIHLAVTDPASGLAATTFQDVQPRTAQISLAASQPGLKLSVNGSPVDVPLTLTALVGTKYTFAADASQIVDGVTYTFQKWSAGRRPKLTYVVGAKDRSIEAQYVPATPS